MKITFLGTSSGAPSRFRNVSAAVLQLNQQSCAWLFDCGEGTQHQIMRSLVRVSQIDRIFVTHMHGDHVFGLPGLLASRSLQAGSLSRVSLYGPPGLQEFLRAALDLTQTRLAYPWEVITVSPGLVFEDEHTRVVCAPTSHRIASFAYAIVERDFAGRFDVQRAINMGIPEGPLYGRLKRGETITLEDGRVIDGSSLTGPKRKGRKVVFSGDTTYSPNLVALADGADVLIHEATYLNEDAALARRAAHSTSVTAAQTAREAGARTLILNHVSSRYEGEGGSRLAELLAEAQAIFPNSYLARDLWSYDVALQQPEMDASPVCS